MASEHAEMRKQSTAGSRKHATLTIPQKCGVIRRLESGKNQRELMDFYKQLTLKEP